MSATTACQPGEHDLSDEALAADLATLTALGNETRYEVLRLIAASDGGRCVCEVEPALDVSQGAVSQALSRLTDAGLLTRRKEGRWRYYESTPQCDRLVGTIDAIRGER